MVLAEMAPEKPLKSDAEILDIQQKLDRPFARPVPALGGRFGCAVGEDLLGPAAIRLLFDPGILPTP